MLSVRKKEEEESYESEYDDETEFQCAYCEEYYEDAKDLEQHSYYYCDKRPIECPICSQSLHRQFIEDHLQLCGTGKIKCMICAAIMHPEDLQDHAIAHNLE